MSTAKTTTSTKAKAAKAKAAKPEQETPKVAPVADTTQNVKKSETVTESVNEENTETVETSQPDNHAPVLQETPLQEMPQQAPEQGKGDAMTFVLCSLPQGISFTLPNGDALTLKGKNADLIWHGAGVNRVPKEAWQEVEKLYGSMQAFQKKMIFEEKSEQRAKGFAQEWEGEKTGFEPVDPQKPGKGVTKAE